MSLGQTCQELVVGRISDGEFFEERECFFEKGLSLCHLACFSQREIPANCLPMQPAQRAPFEEIGSRVRAMSRCSSQA